MWKHKIFRTKFFLSNFLMPVLEESTIQYFFLIIVYFYEIFEIFENVVFAIRHRLADSGNIF